MNERLNNAGTTGVSPGRPWVIAKLVLSSRARARYWHRRPTGGRRRTDQSFAVVIAAMLLIHTLSGCSILPGRGGGDKRVVDEEEITVAEVYISKGRAQCEDESGRPLSETKAELQADGIRVFESTCGVLTGRMAPALCGATTLHINIHGIDQRKFPEAQVLGYEPVASLEDGLGYETRGCD